MWVGIPGFLIDTPDPLEIEQAIERTISAMRTQGMTTDKIVFTAHSLGGIFLAEYLKNHPEKAIAGVLMGSFLERKRFTITDQGLFQIDMPIPILTLAGEMDGLARVFRMAEAYYKLNLHPSDPSN